MTRTPLTDNLHLAPQLLAEADLLLLVRDGRSVAASLVEAWSRTHDQAIKEWRKGARDIIRFTQPQLAEPPRCLVVHYEDLLDDLDSAVAAVFDFTGLDPLRYDKTKAADLPIIGSSYIRDGDGRVTWTPVDRTNNFDPADRFASWTEAQHERFNWLAGTEQTALGYPLSRADGPQWAVATRNVARDVAAPVLGCPAVVARKVGSRLRAMRAERRWRESRRLGPPAA